MKSYRDPTMSGAVRKTDKEFSAMAKLALTIREGRRPPAWIEENSKLFTGIYARLLTDPIKEVEIEAARYKKGV